MENTQDFDLLTETMIESAVQIIAQIRKDLKETGIPSPDKASISIPFHVLGQSLTITLESGEEIGVQHKMTASSAGDSPQMSFTQAIGVASRHMLKDIVKYADNEELSEYKKKLEKAVFVLSGADDEPERRHVLN